MPEPEKKPYQTPQVTGPYANAREMFAAKFKEWIDHAKGELSVHVSIPVVAAEELLKVLTAPRMAWIVERVVPTAAPERRFLSYSEFKESWEKNEADALYFARKSDAERAAILFDYAVISEVQLDEHT